ncbi:MAG TPA: YicC family protein [Caldithrix sp.]|nr:YicC family protein [Caldithrix sp.]
MNTLKSMTGFATVQSEYEGNEVTCEIRSLNSRYLEISVKLPRALADYETLVKELIRKEITRGKIMYTLNFSSLNGDIQNLKINEETVQNYVNLLKQMKEAAGLDSPITLDHLLFFKDVITFEEEKPADDKMREIIVDITGKAMKKLNEMRASEGANLKVDIEKNLEEVGRLTGEIARICTQNARIEFDKMYQRLLSLIDEKRIDRSRLEQEVAIISDRVDISEETIRMKSHIQLFRENLKAGSPIGKKMNFILQEMHRESNTMSNKATMVEISHRVVTIKEDVEKIREQVQNIE